MIFVAAEQGYFATFNQVKAAERDFTRRAVSAASHPENRIGEIDRSVRFVCDVIRAVEAFALVTIREQSAASILFQADDVAVGHRGDEHASLSVKCEPV